MSYFYLKPIPVVIIIYCILNIKKKDYFWNLLISIGILPFVALIFASISSTFKGSGLVGDKGGIASGLFTLIALSLYFWYIHIGALILLIFSIIKKRKNLNKKKNLSIIEKSIMIALIVTNTVLMINLFSADIINRPLILYRLFNNHSNIYYGIGITLEKIGETGKSYSADFLSFITFLCIVFIISLVFFKIKKKSNNYKNN